MAGEEGRGGDEGPSWKARIGQLVPEPGVGSFGVFLLALVTGFLLAISGHLGVALMSFVVAIVALLLALVTPSPAARARRSPPEATPEEGEEREGDREGVEDREGARPDLRVDATPAPTAGRRQVPTPPPEPPPMEEVVVDLGDGDEAPAAEQGDDVWVE